MDKYEFNIKVEQIKKLVNKKDFATAMKIADTIDWRRVRNANLLSMISQVYEKNGEFQEAKEVLLLAFERAPIGKRLLYKLTELALKEGSLGEAEDYYREFCDLAPEDTRQHILRYMILREKDAPVDQLIHSLERYTTVELDEKWMYELAELYAKAGRSADCVQLCDKMILLFGIGAYVEQAKELRQRYAPLNSYQRNVPQNHNGFGGMSGSVPGGTGFERGRQDYAAEPGAAFNGYGTGYQAESGYEKNMMYGGAAPDSYGAGVYEDGTAYGAGVNYGSQPAYESGNGYDTQPGYTGGNDYGVQPDYAGADGYGIQPDYTDGNDYGAQPGYIGGNDYGIQSGYAGGNGYGTEPGYAGGNGYGTEPGYTGGNGYGTESGYTGGNDFGVQSGYAGGDNYGTEPGYAGRDDYGTEPGYAGRDGYGTQSGYAGRNGYDTQPAYNSEDSYGVQPAYNGRDNYEAQVGYNPAEDYGSDPAYADRDYNGTQAVYDTGKNYTDNTDYGSDSSYGIDESYDADAPYNTGNWQRTEDRMPQNRTDNHIPGDRGYSQPYGGYAPSGEYFVDEELMANLHQVAAEKELAAEMSKISTEIYEEPELNQTRVFRGKNNIRTFLPRREEEEKPFYDRTYTPHHMIIEAKTAEEGFEKAVEALKKIHQETGINNQAIKISGSKLAQRGIFNVSDKLAGKDLIVEEAGDLTQKDLEELQMLLERDETGMIVVLIDNPFQIEELHQQNPGFINLFKCIGSEEEAEEPVGESEAEPQWEETYQPEETGLNEELSSGEGLEPEFEPEPEFEQEPEQESEAETESEACVETEAAGESESDPESELIQPAQESESDPEQIECVEPGDYEESDEEPEAAEDETENEESVEVDEPEDEFSDSYDPDEDDEAEDELYEDDYDEEEGEYQDEDDGYDEPDPVDDDEELGIDEFADYAVQYANDIDCSITGKSMLALYERVETMEENGIPLTRANAEDMIEEAADKAEKPSLGGLIKGVFSSKYDKEGLLILKEEHFI